MKTAVLFTTLTMANVIRAQETATGYPADETTISANTICLMIFGITAVVLLIPPFCIQYKGHNIGQCCLIVYICLANLFTAINAIIWPKFAPHTWWSGVGLCDIEVKLQYAIFTGIACSLVTICRRLAMAIDPNKLSLNTSKEDRLRATIEDLIICLLVPIVQVCLHYVIQYNRFYVAAVIGCTASYDNSWPTIVINYMWPPLFALAACYYAVIIVVRLRQHRTKVSSLLGNNSKNLAMFLRLACNSFMIMLIYTPVSIYFFYLNVNIVWFSFDWKLIHDQDAWWTIIFLPYDANRVSTKWTNVVMAFVMFYFFGMGQHATETYRKTLVKLGLARVMPALQQRRGSENGSASTWSSRFSLISHVRRYFERERKTSSATFESDASTLNPTPRKSFLHPTYSHNTESPVKAKFGTLAYSPPSGSRSTPLDDAETVGPLDDPAISPGRDRAVTYESKSSGNSASTSSKKARSVFETLLHTAPDDPTSRNISPDEEYPVYLPRLGGGRGRSSFFFMPSLPNPLAKWMSSKSSDTDGFTSVGAGHSRTPASSSHEQQHMQEMCDMERGLAPGLASGIGVRTTVWADNSSHRAKREAHKAKLEARAKRDGSNQVAEGCVQVCTHIETSAEKLT